MSIEFVPIELTSEWMNNPKGSKLNLLTRAADTLIGRGVAKPVESDEKGKSKGLIEKEVQTPKKDKMVRQSRTKEQP